MAVPKRRDIMIKNSMKLNSKVINYICEKQFPDCPEKPNEKDCKICPYYKK